MATDASAGFAVRRMTRGEAGLAREWAAAEGWNPGLHDAACFYDTDPDGFFVGELNGTPVACVSCVAYDDTFGFLGLYIVRPEHRGRGFGMEVWRAGMAHLGSRNVGLDGVVAQQDNYRKSGFQFAYNNIRYQVAGGGAPVAGTVPLADVPFDEVLAFDRAHFPAPRPVFVRGWIALEGATALGCVRGGQLVGYGVIRASVEGAKIGPLFANDPETAGVLFRNLLAAAPGRSVAIDAPDATANPHVGELVRRYQMTEVFRTARMYTRGVPALPLEHVYGVTSLELG